MKKKNRFSLNSYPINAAKYFTFKRLIIYTAISAILSILLTLTSAGYDGLMAVFTNFALFMILTCTIMNVMAIIIKIRITKQKK